MIFDNMIFIGVYKGVPYYTSLGDIHCLFGWMHKKFDSIPKFKIAVTKWLKQE